MDDNDDDVNDDDVTVSKSFSPLTLTSSLSISSSFINSIVKFGFIWHL